MQVGTQAMQSKDYELASTKFSAAIEIQPTEVRISIEMPILFVNVPLKMQR